MTIIFGHLLAEEQLIAVELLLEQWDRDKGGQAGGRMIINKVLCALNVGCSRADLVNQSGDPARFARWQTSGLWTSIKAMICATSPLEVRGMWCELFARDGLEASPSLPWPPKSQRFRKMIL